MPGELNN